MDGFLSPGGPFEAIKRIYLARHLGSWTGEHDSAHQNFLGQIESRGERLPEPGKSIWRFRSISEHEERKPGMCGTLRPYLPEGELIDR